MQQPILIIMTGHRLAAAEMSHREKAELISLDGSIWMEYNGEDDLEHFCACIKDYYNIDCFNELDISVTILKCGATMEDTVSLFGLFKEMQTLELIDIQRVLPLALTTLGYTKKAGTAHCSLLDAHYEVNTDDDLRVTCRLLDAEPADAVSLRPEAFNFLFWFDAKQFTADDEPLRKVQEELARLQADCQQKSKELETALQQTEKLKAEQAEKEAASQRRITGLENRQKNAQRYLVRVEFPKRDPESISYADNFRRNLIRAFESTIESSIYSWKIKLSSVENGSIVHKSSPLAEVRLVRSDGSVEEKFAIQPPAAGRLFFLAQNDTEVHEGDVVAIIADPTDTYEDAIRWYRSVTNTKG